jgi:hypothetical protein
MNKIQELLRGKKMYLVALSEAVKAIIEFTADNDIGKLLNGLLIAAGIASAKAAIVKSGGGCNGW